MLRLLSAGIAASLQGGHPNAFPALREGRGLGCRAGTGGAGIVMQDAQTSGVCLGFFPNEKQVERQSEAGQRWICILATASATHPWWHWGQGAPVGAAGQGVTNACAP